MSVDTMTVDTAAPAEPRTASLPGVKDVAFHVPNVGGLSADPHVLTIEPDFDGTITFTLDGDATFDNPPITFSDNRTVQYVPPMPQPGVATSFTITWVNDNDSEYWSSAYYTLHARRISSGNVVSLDPTVQNQPPTGP
jgi:hypothetical protein